MNGRPESETMFAKGTSISDALGRWADLEGYFRRNHYAGSGAAASIHLDASAREGHLIFTAPHAVNHFRNGRDKIAEPGTGGLAEILAEKLGGVALASDGSTGGDANWDDESKSSFKKRLRRLLKPGILVIDLHGMKDSYGIDVCIGRGPKPDARSLNICNRLVAALTAAKLSSAVDRPFDGNRKGTLVSFVQDCGGSAIQIELARRLRNPEENPVLAGSLLLALSSALSDT